MFTQPTGREGFQTSCKSSPKIREGEFFYLNAYIAQEYVIYRGFGIKKFVTK